MSKFFYVQKSDNVWKEVLILFLLLWVQHVHIIALSSFIWTHQLQIQVLIGSFCSRKNSVPWIGAIVEGKHSWNISRSPINEVNRARNQHKSLTYLSFHSKFINFHSFLIINRIFITESELETNPEFSTKTIQKILQINDLKWWPKKTLDWEDIFEFRHLVYSENDVIDKLLALKVSLYFLWVMVHFYMYCSSSPFMAYHMHY